MTVKRECVLCGRTVLPAPSTATAPTDHYFCINTSLQIERMSKTMKVFLDCGQEISLYQPGRWRSGMINVPPPPPPHPLASCFVCPWARQAGRPALWLTVIWQLPGWKPTDVMQIAAGKENMLSVAFLGGLKAAICVCWWICKSVLHSFKTSVSFCTVKNQV